MRILIEPRVHGVPTDLGGPRLPGCKSHAQRTLLLAAFTPGERVLRGLPDNDDVAILERVLREWGRDVRARGDQRIVRGAPIVNGETLSAAVGENGTAARTLLMLVPLLGGRLQLDGAPGLRRRPFGAAVAALRALGVTCDREQLPLVADGSNLPHDLPHGWHIDASVSTQPATGALLALALRGGGELTVSAPRAGGYLQITTAVLRAFGWRVDVEESAREQRFRVGGQPAPAGDFEVPADASARAFVVTLAAMHGLQLPRALDAAQFAAHPDLQIDAALHRLRHDVTAPVTLAGLGSHPDCVPALAAAAALRAGSTRLTDLANLRHKESDRLAAMAAGLEAAGAEAHVEGDDLLVRGPLRQSDRALELPTVPDHRVVMALALLGTAAARGVVVGHGAAVAKSWPGFFDWLARCAAVRRISE